MSPDSAPWQGCLAAHLKPAYPTSKGATKPLTPSAASMSWVTSVYGICGASSASLFQGGRQGGREPRTVVLRSSSVLASCLVGSQESYHGRASSIARAACRPKGADIRSQEACRGRKSEGRPGTEAEQIRLEFKHPPHSSCAPLAAITIPCQVVPDMDPSNGTNSGSEGNDEAGDQSGSSSRYGRRACLSSGAAD